MSGQWSQLKPFNFRYTFESLDVEKRIKHYVCGSLASDAAALSHQWGVDDVFSLVERFARHMDAVFSRVGSARLDDLTEDLVNWYSWLAHYSDRDSELQRMMLDLVFDRCLWGFRPTEHFHLDDYRRYALDVYIPSRSETCTVYLYASSLDDAFNQVVEAYMDQPRKHDLPVYESHWKITSLSDDSGDHTLDLLNWSQDLLDPYAIMMKVGTIPEFIVTEPGELSYQPQTLDWKGTGWEIWKQARDVSIHNTGVQP